MSDLLNPNTKNERNKFKEMLAFKFVKIKNNTELIKILSVVKDPTAKHIVVRIRGIRLREIFF